MMHGALRRWATLGGTALSVALGTVLGTWLERRRRRTGHGSVDAGPTGSTASLWDDLWQCSVLPVPSVHAATIGGGQLASRTAAELSTFGLPGVAQLRSRTAYLVSYDARTRTPAWVLEKLDSAGLRGDATRQDCEFLEDESVHAFHRATNIDFRGSGYDRGHMAAAANHKASREAMRDTFLLTNIVPQNPQMNQNAWNDLEQYCRGLTKQYAHVYVCTGPLYLPRREVDGKTYVRYEVIGPNTVAVPTHLFKLLILQKNAEGGDVELRAFVMPNEPIPSSVPRERFLVPLESLERASGFLFQPNIERRLRGGARVISALGQSGQGQLPALKPPPPEV
uniref:Endonuclease n=1 Tax=Petromyzon marinus TaxID=7757 RepID=A0AAJ7SNN2_PETMA|nr:endonuclease G, mitochondrial [Petromyzon marinus]